MDVANFATKFNVERSGLLELIRGELLEGEIASKGINVELYKLNVYGEHLTIAFFYVSCFLFCMQGKVRSLSHTKILLVVRICSDHW